MGASVWSVRVPYQDDLEATLKQARVDAYNRGDFYRSDSNLRARTMSEEEYVAWEMAELRRVTPAEVFDDGWEPSDAFVRQEWRAAQIEVSDADTLLSSQPFSGTHSVIDMTGVAGEPAEGKVAPVTDDVLDELFGTHQPTVAAVERAIDNDTLTGFARWEGAYVIAYAAGKPDTIFFVGHSGD